MNRNITVSIPEHVARWARVWAAEHDTSVSQMLCAFLTENMERVCTPVISDSDSGGKRTAA